MPPSFGNRDDNSITATPCGMQKQTEAINHITNDPGPEVAVVPSRPRTRAATRLNRTRSRSLSPRTSVGVVCVVFMVINLEKEDEVNYSGSTLRRLLKMNRQVRVCAFRK